MGVEPQAQRPLLCCPLDLARPHPLTSQNPWHPTPQEEPGAQEEPEEPEVQAGPMAQAAQAAQAVQAVQPLPEEEAVLPEVPEEEERAHRLAEAVQEHLLLRLQLGPHLQC